MCYHLQYSGNNMEPHIVSYVFHLQ